MAVAPIVGGVWEWNRVRRARDADALKHLRDQEALYLRTVESLALAVDAKDATTYGHIRRVHAYAIGLARLSGISDHNEMMAIETGSLLHDIGKLAVDDYILNKPGPLTRPEFERIKLHAPAGDEILQRVEFPFPVAKLVRHHHERWNGSGYPDGLAGEAIPLGARILAIADAFDAIHASRPYKNATSLDDAVAILRSHAGTLYDPDLVDRFTRNIHDLQAQAEAAVRESKELSFRKYFDAAGGEAKAEDPALPARESGPDASSGLLNLAEFCQGVGQHMEWHDAVAVLSRRISCLLPSDAFAILIDSGEQVLEPIHLGGPGAEALRGMRIGLGKGISGWSAAYQRPMIHARPGLELVDGPARLAAFADSLVVPFKTVEGRVGTFTLYARSPDSYKWEHLEVLRTAVELAEPLLQKRSGREGSSETAEPATGRDATLAGAGADLLQFARQSGIPALAIYLKLDLPPCGGTEEGVRLRERLLSDAHGSLRSELRDSDVVVRYGLDGLIAVLPGLRNEQSARYLQKLQSIVEDGRRREQGNAPPGAAWLAVSALFPEEGSALLPLILALSRRMAERTHGARDRVLPTKVISFPQRH